MTLYLDANAIIYAIEGAPPFRDAVIARLAQAGDAGSIVTSRLTRLECRVKPLRDGDAALLATYDDFFTRTALVIAEIDAAVIERATALRARYALRTPDAIHVATALQLGADVLPSGDAAMARCPEVRVELI